MWSGDMHTFEKHVDTDGTVMVRLPQGLGLVLALEEDEREAWRQASHEAFTDDPALVEFVDELCDAMAVFLSEK